MLRLMLLAIVTVSLGVGASPAVAALSIPWATQTSGTTSSAKAKTESISTLPDGSAIVTGYFSGTVAFGAGISITSNSSTNQDIYVAKMDPSGAYVWAVRAGSSTTSTYIDIGRGVSALADGSAIVTGSFSGTADFGSFSLVGDSGSDDDVFVAKISASGVFVWATKAGGSASGFRRGRDVSVLSDGSAIVTGSFRGTANFGSSTPLTSSGSGSDLFVSKIDASGAFVWATKAGGAAGDDSSYGVSALSDGSAIVTGYIEPTATFPTVSGSIALTGSSGAALFVAKIDAAGAFTWATQAVRTSGVAQGYRVSALADGSAILTGLVDGTAAFGTTSIASNSSSNDIVVAKVDASGAWVWAKSAGSSNDDQGNGISAMPDGSAIVTGYFRGAADFGAITVTSNSVTDDIFVAKIDTSGDWVWVTSAGGTTNADEGKAVSAMPDGSAIVTGYFTGGAIFGATTLTSTGNRDVFAAKFLDAAQAPAAPLAVAGDGQATVTITPLAGGSVTTYTVLASSGGNTCTVTAPATSCTITGLTNGTAYTFTVTATNAAGTSPASAASAPVTPSAAAAVAVATVAMANNIRLTVLPSSTRLVSGETMRVGIRATNIGKSTATSVTTCLTLPANLVVTHTGGAKRSGRSLCFSLGNLKAGATRTSTVHVRAVTTSTVTRRVIGTARSSAKGASTTARSTPIRITPRSESAEAVTG
jgi:hypothetical protein